MISCKRKIVSSRCRKRHAVEWENVQWHNNELLYDITSHSLCLPSHNANKFFLGKNSSKHFMNKELFLFTRKFHENPQNKSFIWKQSEWILQHLWTVRATININIFSTIFPIFFNCPVTPDTSKAIIYNHNYSCRVSKRQEKLLFDCCVHNLIIEQLADWFIWLILSWVIWLNLCERGSCQLLCQA